MASIGRGIALQLVLVCASSVGASGLRTSQTPHGKAAADLGVVKGVQPLGSSWPPPSLAGLRANELPPPSKARQTLEVSGVPSCIGPAVEDLGEGPLFLPSEGAAHEAVAGTPRRAGACQRLGDAFGKQVEDMLRNRGRETWVWTVSNRVYGDSLADWQVQMRRVGLPNAVVVAVDVDPAWARDLCAMGFQVVDAAEQGKVEASVAYAKFSGAAHFARLGAANVFHELDIFWERGAVDVFQKLWEYTEGFDIALEAQPGSEINIGLWMSPASASRRLVEDFMKFVWHVASQEHVFDQVAFSKIALQCCTVERLEDPKLEPTPPPWWEEMEAKGKKLDIVCPKSLRRLRVAALRPNSVIKQGYFGTPARQDAAPDKLVARAWHIWSRAGALHGGRAKLVVAQNAGLWEGANCYYEQCPGKERYIAWDGDLGHAADERAAMAMKLLVDLAWSSGRTLVMPRANGTFGEQFFGVAKFEGHMAFRGSNFLFQPLMRNGSLYPVSQVAVGRSGEASLQYTAPDMSSSKEYFKIPAGVPLGHAVAAMLKVSKAASSKTVLISALLPSDDAADRAVEQSGSCGATEKSLDLCAPKPAALMTAHDVC